MSKQYNKAEKRRRRARYLKRKNDLAKGTGKKTKTDAA
jgi:hypothetical protein